MPAYSINGQIIGGVLDLPSMDKSDWENLPIKPPFSIWNDVDYHNEPSDNSVSVTADGVKTNSQLLNALFALVDPAKVTRNTKLVRKSASGATITFDISYSDNQNIYCSFAGISSQSVQIIYTRLHSTTSSYAYVVGSTYTDDSSTIVSSGTTFTLYYNIVAVGNVEVQSWTKVAYSTPTTYTQGQYTQVTLSATPNLAQYSEVMLVIHDYYQGSGYSTDTINCSAIAPIGAATSVIASYSYPSAEGGYMRAVLQFGGDKTTISKAYFQDGGNHTSNNTYSVEIYAR